MSKLSLERKAEIVDHYINTTDGYTTTAKKFGISESVVKMLVAQYKGNGIQGLIHKNGSYSGKFKLHVLEYQKLNNLSKKVRIGLKKEVEKLKEEVEWLRMENAILKKLNALIQEEEESEQETKPESSEN